MPHDSCTEVNYKNTEAGGIPSLPRTEPGMVTLQISVSAPLPSRRETGPLAQGCFLDRQPIEHLPRPLPFLPSFPFASRQLLEA